MDEFTMSAFGRYPDGSSGDAFAEVSACSLPACFAAMAAEVADWLPQALARGEGNESPRAIELTLQWSGAPAATPAPDGPEVPSDPARRRAHPPRRDPRCAARHRHCCAAAGACSCRPARSARLMGAEARAGLTPATFSVPNEREWGVAEHSDGVYFAECSSERVGPFPARSRSPRGGPPPDAGTS